MRPEAADKLVRFRERLEAAIGGRSVLEVARKSGLSEGALRNYRDGSSLPTIDRLIALALETDVNVLWLATGEGPMRGTDKELTEYRATPPPGQIDQEALREAIEIVEEALQQTGAQRSPERRARLIKAVYDARDLDRERRLEMVLAALE